MDAELRELLAAMEARLTAKLEQKNEYDRLTADEARLRRLCQALDALAERITILEQRVAVLEGRQVHPLPN